MIAFLSVAMATFLCLSMIWPLSVKSWRTESEISLTLTKRFNAGEEFQNVLSEVVKRHTSADSLANIVRHHGLGEDGSKFSTAEIGERIHQRLQVVLVADPFDEQRRTVRVGVEGAGFAGKASEKEEFFVNMLATTLAKDFMLSPLAGILPTQPLPTDDVDALQQRYAAIEGQANSLLTQIQSNLEQSAGELASNDTQSLSFDDGSFSDLEANIRDLESQRSRIASSGGDSVLEMAAVDEQINDAQNQLSQLKSGSSTPFQMASHATGSSVAPNAVGGLVESLHTTIGDLANVAADACNVAESASRTTPAFTILGVNGRAAIPVGAVPSRRDLMLLLLASGLFAAIVCASYKPFAQRGFEDIEQAGKKLDLPVIATLHRRNRSASAAGSDLGDGSSFGGKPAANQIVSASKWILFAGLMLTIGFCLVNSNIGSAFLTSPFHGFAQIVWTLQGH